MKTVKEVLQKAGDTVGFPLTPTRIREHGLNPDVFLDALIDDLEKCSDASESKIVQTLVASRTEYKTKKEVTS